MLADEIRRMVPNFRAEAASLMIDTATVRLPDGEPTFDAGTGLLTPVPGAVVYHGMSRLRQPTPSESEVLFGDRQVTRTQFIACFPHDVTGVVIGSTVIYDESSDPDVLIRRFRVTGIPLATFTFYKGFPVEVVE